MSTQKTRTPDFEQALADLEAVVERLERGELPLEEALAQFERGIGLARSCQDALKQAEQKVEILLERTLQAEPAPFTPDEPEA
ncbi:MAG TPA: exodeoxyribonuclease VII small subunit [Burkholderiales bacterium]|nr:exodeoxyribonuclease VII small subunit [Burkholderiales bacterium]